MFISPSRRRSVWDVVSFIFLSVLMPSSPFCRRFALAVVCLISAHFLATVSNAKANTFTYSIVDYPSYEADSFTGGTDKISGTIITDSNGGTLTSADILGGYFAIQNPVNGVVSFPLVPQEDFIVAGLVASPTALTLTMPPVGAPANDLLLEYYSGSSQLNLIYTRWDEPIDDAYDLFQGYAQTNPQELLSFSKVAAYPSTLDLGSNASWIVATAIPEPTTVTLLGAGLLGLGFAYLRRRRAKI